MERVKGNCCVSKGKMVLGWVKDGRGSWWVVFLMAEDIAITVWEKKREIYAVGTHVQLVGGTQRVAA